MSRVANKDRQVDFVMEDVRNAAEAKQRLELYLQEHAMSHNMATCGPYLLFIGYTTRLFSNRVACVYITSRMKSVTLFNCSFFTFAVTGISTIEIQEEDPFRIQMITKPWLFEQERKHTHDLRTLALLAEIRSMFPDLTVFSDKEQRTFEVGKEAANRFSHTARNAEVVFHLCLVKRHVTILCEDEEKERIRTLAEQALQRLGLTMTVHAFNERLPLPAQSNQNSDGLPVTVESPPPE